MSKKPKLYSRSKLSQKDMFEPSAKIPEQKIDRNFGTPISSDQICYTMFGRHHFIDPQNNPILVDKDGVVAEDNDLTFAKKKISENDGSTRYFVKTGSSGRLFNPSDMYAEGTHARFNSKRGEAEWKFKEVNKKVFEYYLAFLRTKNQAFFQCAEREIF